MISFQFQYSRVEPIEYVQRPAGQGLGAIKKIEGISRRRKPGEEQRKVSTDYYYVNTWTATRVEETQQQVCNNELMW